MVHEMGLEQREPGFPPSALPRALEFRAAANVLSSGFLEKAGLEK